MKFSIILWVIGPLSSLPDLDLISVSDIYLENHPFQARAIACKLECSSGIVGRGVDQNMEHRKNKGDLIACIQFLN